MKFREFRPGISVIDFLLHYTEARSIVIFRDHGWQIGVTWIDYEDLFTRSLNICLLHGKVREAKMEKCDWATEPVIVVEIE